MAAKSWHGNQPRLLPTYGEIPEIMSFPESASEDFKAGTPVKLDNTAGTVTIATDATTGFLGIAMEDASGTTSTAINVMVCTPQTPVIARVTDDGTDALPTTLTQGVAYDWYVDADDVFYVDGNATDGPVLIYERPIYKANDASSYWGQFRLLAGQAGNLDEAGA